MTAFITIVENSTFFAVSYKLSALKSRLFGSIKIIAARKTISAISKFMITRFVVMTGKMVTLVRRKRTAKTVFTCIISKTIPAKFTKLSLRLTLPPSVAVFG